MGKMEFCVIFILFFLCSLFFFFYIFYLYHYGTVLQCIMQTVRQVFHHRPIEDHYLYNGDNCDPRSRCGVQMKERGSPLPLTNHLDAAVSIDCHIQGLNAWAQSNLQSWAIEKVPGCQSQLTSCGHSSCTHPITMPYIYGMLQEVLACHAINIQQILGMG